MRQFRLLCIGLSAAALLSGGCSRPTMGTGKVTKIAAGEDAQKQAQTALIKAKPGDVVEFGEGKFELNSTLSLTVDNIIVRGQGEDKTILAFNQQGQGTGGEGLLVSSGKGFLIENLAIEDAKGDAIKVTGCDGVTFRKVKVSWTGGPKETNGAYGLYPVLSKNILIEDCVVTDASDAGIYVGQSENIIVRRNRAENNVAGIEIENSINADVYENVATGNTGGILVFSLPDLKVKVGRRCRVHNNQVVANNHENFAPKGNTVAGVPAGTGVMIMANREVEVFENNIENNQNIGVSIVSYLVTGKPFAQDQGYDPFCDSIYIHDNKFIGGGDKPSGDLGKLVASFADGRLPAIVYDGVVDEKKAVGGKLPEKLAIRIRNNGEADFLNFDFAHLNLENPAESKAHISRDLKPYEGDNPKLPAVKIAGVK